MMPALARAYRPHASAMRRWAWMGSRRSSTGRTWRSNLQDLHERLKAKRYRHQPIRRVHIPKDQGKTRPIGHFGVRGQSRPGRRCARCWRPSTSRTFLDCSYGFRPGRSAHDALRTLDQSGAPGRGELDPGGRHRVLLRQHGSQRAAWRCSQERVADGSLLRLIGKCLHVGVLDGEAILGAGRWAPRRGRCCRRCWATSICTMCSTCGSSAR